MGDNQKFTPGPWRVKPQCGQVWAASTGKGFYQKGLGIAVAIVDSWDEEPPEEEVGANQHLIAAAPELYEALENLLVFQDGESVPRELWADYRRAVENAEAALIKARGEE